MVEGLKETQVKLLTYLVYLLISVLTIATIAIGTDLQQFKSKMPDSYVRLERYRSDIEANRRTLGRMENKIDTINKYLLQEKRNE